MDVTIIDTGLANVGSVANMCRRLGVVPAITHDPKVVDASKRIILPGVGAFDHAVRRLRELELTPALLKAAHAGTPLLGICLGMQLLLETSEEGDEAGLGLIQGRVRRLPQVTSAGPVRIPHMGWSRLNLVRDHPVLTSSVTDQSRFYFVHSYAAVPANTQDILATSMNGDPFVSVIGRGNILGAQFHPEKSHLHGKALLRSFLEWS